MSDPTKLRVRCPDCDSDLVIDASTGEVLSHKKPKAPLAGGKDLDSLFAEMKSQKDRAEEVFAREQTAYKDRERLLEEKFKEALKRAEEDTETGPPKRPFDLD